MSDDPDIGEAVDYILSERPKLTEDDVWAVLVALQDPPHRRSDGLAVDVVRQAHPALSRRTVKTILSEWRAYAELVDEDDVGF